MKKRQFPENTSPLLHLFDNNFTSIKACDTRYETYPSCKSGHEDSVEYNTLNSTFTANPKRLPLRGGSQSRLIPRQPDHGVRHDPIVNLEPTQFRPKTGSRAHCRREAVRRRRLTMVDGIAVAGWCARTNPAGVALMALRGQQSE